MRLVVFRLKACKDALLAMTHAVGLSAHERVLMTTPADGVVRVVYGVLQYNAAKMAERGLLHPTADGMRLHLDKPSHEIEKLTQDLEAEDAHLAKERQAETARVERERREAEELRARVAEIVEGGKATFKHEKAERLREAKKLADAERKLREGDLPMDDGEEMDEDEPILSDAQSSDGFDAAEVEREATRSLTNSPALPSAELAPSPAASGSRRGSGASSVGR